MIFLLFSLSLLNVVLGVSSSPSHLLLILFTNLSYFILFLIFAVDIWIKIFIFPLITCFVRINLLFFFFLFVSVNNGIPLWFRCFKGKHNPKAYSIDLILEGISFCSNLFPPNQYHVIFLADRWFPHIKILSHIQTLRLLFLHPR